MTDIEKRVRELFAAELDADHRTFSARMIRAGQISLGADYSAAMRAIAAALTPPEGWVLVPVEPTEEQLYAMEKWTSGGCPHLKEMYKASIIAARPESPNA